MQSSIKAQLITITYPYSVQFRLQLVLIITTLQNLKQFTINEYNVKDSFSFCKQILDQDTNLFIKTFDNQSLFTNIPLDEATGICVNMVFEKRKEVKGMLKRHFKQLLIFFC